MCAYSAHIGPTPEPREREMTRYISDSNFAADARNQDAAAPILYVELADGSIDEVELPTKWKLCSVCGGEGRHVNPAIDCDGLSSEDFDADPDFADDYRSGVYDIECNRCHGRTTERVVDWERLTAEQRAQYERQLADDAACRAERLAEIRMGA